MSTFNQCPRKFYYEYVLRLPRRQKDYFILGTFTHYVLELFFKSLMENRDQAIASLMGECFASAREKFPEATEPILIDSKTILQNYLGRVIKRLTLPERMALENKFNICVDGINVTGVIDRIDFGTNGELFIIDYKTGKKAKSEKDFKTDMQLPLYALAAHKIYETPLEKITCQLDHLKVKSTQTLQPTQETVDRVLNAIVESYESIQKQYNSMEKDGWADVGPENVATIKTHKEWSKDLEKQFTIFVTKFSKHWEPKPGWYCNYCDFYRTCSQTMW